MIVDITSLHKSSNAYCFMSFKIKINKYTLRMYGWGHLQSIESTLGQLSPQIARGVHYCTKHVRVYVRAQKGY